MEPAANRREFAAIGVAEEPKELGRRHRRER
jgi:hypothetical protein